jgi:hypothetical protein
VNAFRSQALLQKGMEYCNITVPGDPFRLLQKPAEFKAIQYADRTIAATCTKDGPDIGPVEHLLKVRCPLEICSCKGIVSPKQVFTVNNLQVPAAQELYGLQDLRFSEASGRGRDADGIAWLQERWTDHGRFWVELSTN